MSEGYEVVGDALTAHARALTTLADEIQGATNPAQTRLPSDALGQVGHPLTALVDQLVTAGNRALESGVRAMIATSDGVRESAGMFTHREKETGSGFGGVGV
ncbi:type VII secretion target [Kibdelosporangium persicum]|uniref:Excreted virulence factor EspC, type VII ESX diderm n=1 Tax=Kibdelosporangium persicum TaxID=2698649 RepID=A0ABX2FCC3_9PSEU|nr:type VII secretion target [Kibdelosporangium persicum]NRN69024.1 Excreted virulence factor EspC, type VII ESX diderm [Kibdelosporangium persicum]